MTVNMIDLPSSKVKCNETYQAYGTLMVCTREVGHKGDHQDFSGKTQYHTFGEGGSSSHWYRSAFGNGHQAYKCTACGAVSVWNYTMLKPAADLCFSCNLWTNRVDAFDFDADDQVVIDGRLYTFGERNGQEPKPGLGHGGATLFIECFDGRRVKHNDVWSGGKIPEHFRELLPDTARFSKETW